MLRFLRHAKLLKLALLSLVLAGFALATAMAVSPDLHRQWHADADHEDHECLVTALLSGGVDHAPVVAMTLQPPVLTPVCGVERSAVPARSFFLECSIFEHGPPVVS